MEQRVSLITLGVADLGRSRSFDEHLGWLGQEMEETVFFQAGGQAVVLWSRDKLAADAGIHDDGTSAAGLRERHIAPRLPARSVPASSLTLRARSTPTTGDQG